MKTAFTQMFNCELPIMAGPMFLVSTEDLVVAISENGGIGGIPSLNWRSCEQFKKGIRSIKNRTQKPFAVNLIVNKSNPRRLKDLEICAEEKVPLVITSLGDPRETLKAMHAVNCKVFCDITTLDYARKVQDLGADGIIAVSVGAGGHPGLISPLVLIPYLKKHLSIPIVAAGGIATGSQIAAAILLGASAVQIGTRFIASTESNADERYKKAILEADPEDIVLTKKISGTPAAVIRTPYIIKTGLELNPIEAFLHKNKKTKIYIKMLRAYLGAKTLERAIHMPTWKEVWSAGQSVGLIEDILPAKTILENLMNEYNQAFNNVKITPTDTIPNPASTSP